MNLLLIAPADSYRVGDFLGAAEDIGCEVTVATDAASAIVEAAITVRLGDPVAAADALVARAGAALDGVVGTDGPAVAVAAQVADRLGLRGPSPAAVRVARDKHLQRKACAAAPVPQPPFALVRDGDDDGWSTFPAVVKPLDRSASQGVLRVDGRDELRPAARRVRAMVGSERPVLVEALLPGREVALEGLLRDGHLDVLRVFDKPDTPRGPTFPETLLVSPARFSGSQLARLTSVVEQAARAMGLDEGPVHAECFVDGDEVWFLELAARTIGGLCSRALDHGGTSHEELILRHALGLPAPALPPPSPSGILMLPVPHTGRLRSVRGLDEARAVDGVTDVVLSVGPGEAVSPLPEGDRYLGFVFAGGATADAVEATLRAAWARLEVDITPG